MADQLDIMSQNTQSTVVAEYERPNKIIKDLAKTTLQDIIG